jgi:hypothetical protein
MGTLGWLFILVALLLVRQVSRGRVMNLGKDLSDTFIAIASGDSDALGEILARTGDSSSPTQASLTIAVGPAPSANIRPARGLLAAAVRRGTAAKGYRWASAGPDYYDCSGLIYRACTDLGYTGPRFSTASVRSVKGMKVISSAATQGPGLAWGPAQPNDIVLWPAGSGGATGHMGVVSGPDQFYSARSTKSGIGYAKISTWRNTKPIYLRYTPGA